MRASVRLLGLLCGLTAGTLAPAAPVVSPDRLADVADTGEDPFPAFDDFAWRAFLALNWPAGAHGEPDLAAGLGDPGARVWESFAPNYETLPPPGAATGANPCAAPAGAKVVSAFRPYAEFNQTSFTPGEPDSPLVARNGTYVRYETRFDRIEHEWLRGAVRSAPEGAIAIKAAWRLLTPNDSPAARARYYIAADAWVTDVAASRAAGRIVCAKADLALVGLHIVVRTKSQPQGVWATFEHVDNVPPVGLGEAREPDALDDGAAYSFNDPKAQQNEIFPPQGWKIAAPVSAQNPPRLAPTPTQALRRHPVRREIMAANRAYWALPQVARSVWRRYMLVSVQWPTVIAPHGPENDGRYFPGLKIEPNTKAAKYKVDETDDGRNLANSVMETYQQDLPSSCMACHHAVANARGYDFVGALGAAPPRN